MQPGRLPAGDPPQPRRPWEVFRARRDHHPSNPLRYAHTIRFAVSVAILAVLITVIVVPARSVETEMHADVAAAKRSGFPQLPPKYGTAEQIDKFIDEWNLDERGSPSRQTIEALSARVGEYDDDSALFATGMVFGLIGLVFLSAFAFTRALNNLYALGHEFSTLSPAWAFISWFIPLLSFVLPWRVVAETVSHAWSPPGDGERPRGTRCAEIVSGLWGVSFIGLWLLNPFTVNVFVRSNDIDGWLNKLEWTEWMMVWLPVPALLTAAVLMAVTVKQHRRYLRLDSRAGSRR